MKLKYKIAIIFTLLSIIPIFLISTMFFNYGKKIIEKKTIEHLKTTNDLKYVQLEQWVDNRRDILKSIADIRLMKNALIRIMDKRILEDRIRDRFQSIFLSFVKKNFFVELFIVKIETGQVIYSSDIVQEGKFKDNQPFFLKGRDESFVQDIMFDVSNNVPFMIMSVPIKDDYERTIAILAGKADLMGLSQFMERRNDLIKTEDIFLVNKFNYYITEPRFSSDFALKKTNHNSGLETSSKKGSFIGVNRDYRNQKVLCSIKYLEKWKLNLITKMDLQEAYEPIQKLKKTVILVSLALAAISAIFGFILSYGYTKPLEKLSDGAKRVGSGDLDIRLDIQRKGEFYDVARSFETMASQLKATMVSKRDLELEIEVRKETEGTLNKTMDKLKQSNEDLQQFAYVASHDLQEPLRMISSFTQLLADRYENELDEKAKRWINFAVDGANRMQTLIQDLLSFSRINTHGKDFEEINSEDVLKLVLNNLKVLVEESGVRINYKNLPVIRADENQMVQLFQNLLSNGIKFADKDDPEIDIKAVKHEDEWYFTVSDNGIGIKQEYFDKIFIIFQRLHSREEYEGTGLGLAVCKRIIQRHGGRIWVESKPNEGSYFTFTIPL